MIIYRKVLWGLPLLLRMYGSALPRTVPFAVTSALFTALLLQYRREEIEEWWGHPYPFQVFSFIVTFILVFRSNYGYSRYSEGATQLNTLSGKLVSAASQLIAFDSYGGLSPVALSAAARPHIHFAFKDFQGKSAPSEKFIPPSDDVAYHKHRQFVKELMHLFSLLHALALQRLRNDDDLRNISLHSGLDDAPPADPLDLPQVKEHPPLFSRVSITQLFHLTGTPRHTAEYNAAMPLGVIGHLSEQERQALTLGLHNTAEHRPHIVYQWIYELITRRQALGGLNVPSPILARPIQELTLALDAFAQCEKLAQTPFPFPYAQLCLVLLLLHTFTVPFLIIAYIHTVWLASFLSIISVFTYWAINETARDIEDPFVYEPNDLPLAKLQYDFNERLHCISGARRPAQLQELRTTPEGIIIREGMDPPVPSRPASPAPSNTARSPHKKPQPAAATSNHTLSDPSMGALVPQKITQTSNALSSQASEQSMGSRTPTAANSNRSMGNSGGIEAMWSNNISQSAAALGLQHSEQHGPSRPPSSAKYKRNMSENALAVLESHHNSQTSDLWGRYTSQANGFSDNPATASRSHVDSHQTQSAVQMVQQAQSQLPIQQQASSASSMSAPAAHRSAFAHWPAVHNLPTQSSVPDQPDSVQFPFMASQPPAHAQGIQLNLPPFLPVPELGSLLPQVTPTSADSSDNNTFAQWMHATHTQHNASMPPSNQHATAADVSGLSTMSLNQMAPGISSPAVHRATSAKPQQLSHQLLYEPGVYQHHAASPPSAVDTATKQAPAPNPDSAHGVKIKASALADTTQSPNG